MAARDNSRGTSEPTAANSSDRYLVHLEENLPRLNEECRAAINHFTYSMVNGLPGYPLLDSIDYQVVLIEEGSTAEQACAIFCNVLELDVGRPTAKRQRS